MSHIGSIRLGEPRPGHIAAMFDELRKPGASRRGRASKGLSETTLLHTHGVLRTALAWPVRQRLALFGSEDVGDSGSCRSLGSERGEGGGGGDDDDE